MRNYKNKINNCKKIYYFVNNKYKIYHNKLTK